MDIQTTGRTTLTAVGTRDQFIEAAATFGTLQANVEMALARMVAYAYSCYHKGGEDKTFGLDYIRENVRMAKDQARRLGNALTRVTRTPPEEGQSVAKAALHFANEFTADFYSHETKARLAKKKANQEKALEKQKAAAKAEADKLKKLKDEAKAEALAELEESGEIEVTEFTLIGKDGVIDVLTEGEWMALRIFLNDLRLEQAQVPPVKAVAVH